MAFYPPLLRSATIPDSGILGHFAHKSSRPSGKSELVEFNNRRGVSTAYPETSPTRAVTISVAREPKTISQLAEALDLSSPSVHTHINDMMKSERLRESEEWEKRYPTERYYEPNFPVFKAEECAEFMALCKEMSKDLVTMFEKRRQKMERAFNKTGLSKQGWELSDITQCLFANMYRSARTLLEQRGLLSPLRNIQTAQSGYSGQRSLNLTDAKNHEHRICGSQCPSLSETSATKLMRWSFRRLLFCSHLNIKSFEVGRARVLTLFSSSQPSRLNESAMPPIAWLPPYGLTR